MVSSHKFSVTPLQRIMQRLMRMCRPLCLAIPLWAASTGLASAESWKVNLQDADIKAFINEVATITNQNFVLDPRINGNVTVISNKALSRDEIYQLFLSVMQVNGIAAIDSGTTVKLVPDNVAKQSGVAVDLRGDSVGESLATRVIYLTNTQAAEVLGVIRPLMPQSAHAAAVPGVNALVLSDRADSLNQLTALIRDLDSNVNDSLRVIPLRHVDSERMMELISALVSNAGSGQAQGGSNQLKVIADSASDRLLVKGSPEMIAKVQEMVNQLDTTPSRRLSGLRVFRLKYASASHIAEMLRGLLANQSINSAGATSTLESASLNDASSAGAGLSSAANDTSTNSTAASALSSAGAGTGSASANGRPFSIIADETQNAVIVNAAPELMFEIEDAVNQLDSRRAQVLIQAAIVEVSGDDATQLGVQWALGNANSGYGVVNFNNVGASATSLAAAALAGGSSISAAAGSIAGALVGIGDSSKDSQGNTQFYGAILQALDSTTSANLLSMPSILTLDNEKASILVGQNVPFVTGSYTTSGNSSTNPFQTIDRQDIGINLNVIPHIGDNGTVRLEVSQEVSSVVPGSTGNASGLITNKSLINTTILADDQQTIALGGLMRDNTTTRQQKVPGLGNVPVIGRLFRSDNDSTQKSNLIIFLQPTILRDGGAVASVTERKYNQMRVLQLVIDKNGTIKQLPLSGTEGWNGNVSADYELMPLNPLVPKRDQTPTAAPQGFTKVDSPSSGITTYPLKR
ncbi:MULTISPECIES: type II secretion system secretin GspD [unclassified Psychrobacter]|uniref:type II secretion system secretin GspD n=1 Tax=unclassified Psychrobacter TaxID=196806 RepID=UPI000946A860|nr:MULTISPECIES: type II secretion system secretin GspD [unclassified Psychrobacter]OLF41852.1 type II secretion system protein GspD [Psychrobacter sp. Rd 27.2]PJX22638.1 type II secretion system protein GspD [Psychrobacter sp. L7]